MSVVATMEATPNRVSILYRFLNDAGPMSQQHLLSFLSPTALSKKGEGGEAAASVVAKRVLAECQTLGLVQKGPEDESLEVPEELRHLDQQGLRSLLENRLTQPDEAAAYGQEQVPHALAWFLCQNPATPLAFRENQRAEIEAETGGRPLELTSAARFQQLAYWVQYLGLGWHIAGLNGPELVADPTAAFSGHLQDILQSSGEAPIGAVIEALGERLPIVETGAAREAVEGWLPPGRRRGVNDLSPSTSLALLRLERRGIIALDQKSDARVMMRLLAWPNVRPVSHVVWKQTAGR